MLVGKPEGERPLGRPRHRWETNTVFSGMAALCIRWDFFCQGDSVMNCLCFICSCCVEQCHKWWCHRLCFIGGWSAEWRYCCMATQFNFCYEQEIWSAAPDLATLWDQNVSHHCPSLECLWPTDRYASCIILLGALTNWFVKSDC